MSVDEMVIRLNLSDGVKQLLLIPIRQAKDLRGGIEHYLRVTEKRHSKRRKILLDAMRAVRAYVEEGGIADDSEGPLFRPLARAAQSLLRRHRDRKTPWRLVKKYCRAACIDPDCLGGRGIGIHSLRKTAINAFIRDRVPKRSSKLVPLYSICLSGDRRMFRGKCDR
jgi:hypothetical protein